MKRLAHDVKLALRGFRRAPGFPIAVVAILGISIGAATAIFSAFNAVLIQRLPVSEQERIAVFAPFSVPTVELSPPATDLPQLRLGLRAVSGLAGVAHWGTTRSPFVDGERTVLLNHSDVSANYFEVLGARAALGRLLRTDDETALAAPPMVVSFRAWRAVFGGDSSVIGRRIMWPYTRTAYTIVGVAPAGLDYPLGVECWTPMARNDVRQVLLIGRLAPNTSLHVAQREVLDLSRRMRPALKHTGASAVTLQEAIVGVVRPALLATGACVTLLLLIACVNIGNLYLVRRISRSQELFVRRALGASYGNIVGQLLTEIGLLASAGGALGITLAVAFLRVMVYFAPTQLPRLDTVRIDGTVVALAVAVTAISAIICGVLPAMLAARSSSTIRARERSGTQSRSTIRLRDVLVAAQVSVTVVMLAVAGLVSNSLLSLQRAPLGFSAGQLYIASVAWDATRFKTPEQMADWEQRVERGLRNSPVVKGVTPILIPPFLGGSVWHAPIEAESEGSATPNAVMESPLEIGGPEYFSTMGMAIKYGRGFTEADENSVPRTVVVSDAVANRLWPAGNALGKRLRLVVSGATTPQDWSTVVGVVADTRFRSLREMSATVYVPWRQMDAWQGYFAIRSTSNSKDLAALLRSITHDVDPTIVLGNLSSMEGEIAVPLSTPRFTALLVGIFGMVALLLASVGLFSVMAANVREQTREIGIRSALGATPGQIAAIVVRHGLGIAVAGAGIGLVGALASTHGLRALLFEVRPNDPKSLLQAIVILLLVGIAAALIPIRRATRISPMDALRHD